MSVIHHLRPEVRVEVAGIDEVGHVLTALDLELAWTGLGPVCLRRVLGSELVCSSTIPLVSVFTADEQRGRSSQNYLRSAVGDRLRILPAHVDPTVAYHQKLHLCRGDEVLESWDVDLRWW